MARHTALRVIGWGLGLGLGLRARARARARVGVGVGARAGVGVRVGVGVGVRLALRPCEPAGRYESRLTQWKASMCMTHGDTKYIPLSLKLRAKPISLLRSMPSTTHRSSM